MKSWRTRKKISQRLKKRAQLNTAKTSLNHYKSGLEEVEKQLKSGKVRVEEFAKKLDDMGKKATEAGKTLTKTVTAPIVAVGGLAIKSAMELDEGYDTIITKTGATGDALQKLNDVADTVFGSMPVEMANVGTAVGEVNTRFQSTGDELEDLSKKFIQFAEINDVDLNASIGTADKLMQQFGVDVKDTGNVLGIVTARAQETGIAADSLMNSVSANSATFKELGFSLTDSINLLAQFEVNGVDSSAAIAGLRKSVTNMAKDGLSADEALGKIIKSIQEAETDTKALNIASETFGTKGAIQMTDAIRSGRFSLDELKDSMKNYGQTVQQTYEETLDPWDKMKVATNDLKLAGADLAGEIFNELSPIIDSLCEKIDDATEQFSGLDDGQKKTIVTVGILVASIGPLLTVFGLMGSGVSNIIMLTSKVIDVATKVPGTLSTIGTGMKAVWTIMKGHPIGTVITIVGALIAIFVTLYNKCEWFRDGVDKIFGKMKTFLEGIKKWLKGIFDFDWKLPQIKLPHFRLVGEFSLSKMTVPRLSVDWYAKGGILNKPTIFGMNGDTPMGGGEAGMEAVLPIDLLKRYIREENEQNNQMLISLLTEALKEMKIMAENNIYIGDSRFVTVLTDMVMKKMDENARNRNAAKGVFIPCRI